MVTGVLALVVAASSMASGAALPVRMPLAPKRWPYSLDEMKARMSAALL